LAKSAYVGFGLTFRCWQSWFATLRNQYADLEHGIFEGFNSLLIVSHDLHRSMIPTGDQVSPHLLPLHISISAHVR